jgi:hypothetical protein
MAINVDTQDLENYPGTTKRVTVDQTSIVPQGQGGDEKYMMSFSTTAYSDNTLRTAIQDLYVTNFKVGWCKSSGFAGSSGKFDVTSSAYKMKIKIDATVSGSDGSGWYEIELGTSTTPITGEAVADDMQDKIRALGDNLNTADAGYILSYKNASVEYANNKFWILSGSMGQFYTGSYRSSVQVAASSSDDVSVNLGFDNPWTSEDLAGASVSESSIASDFTGGDSTLNLSYDVGASAGDALFITDGAGTYDYFIAKTVSAGTTIGLNTDNTGITNSYSVSGTKVQLLKEQDPEAVPTLYYTNVDALVRFGLRHMIAQIDYSS